MAEVYRYRFESHLHLDSNHNCDIQWYNYPRRVCQIEKKESRRKRQRRLRNGQRGRKKISVRVVVKRAKKRKRIRKGGCIRCTKYAKRSKQRGAQGLTGWSTHFASFGRRVSVEKWQWESCFSRMGWGGKVNSLAMIPSLKILSRRENIPLQMLFKKFYEELHFFSVLLISMQQFQNSEWKTC